MLVVNDFSVIGRSVDFFAQLTLEEASEFFLELNKGAKREDFHQDVIEPLLKHAALSGDDAAAQTLEAIEKKNIPGAVAASMAIAVVYSLEALRKHEQHETEVAWSLIAEARFHLAYMYAGTDFKNSVPELVKQQKRVQAQSGAKAKVEKMYGPIKDKALELALKLRPTPGWKSRGQAANEIAKHLYESQQLAPLSWGQAPKTIHGWLSKHPEAATLFKPKSKKMI